MPKNTGRPSIKNNRKSLNIVFLTLFSFQLLSAQNGADAILGTWLSDTKEAKVQIYQEAGVYMGKIVWLKDPNTPKGDPKTDKKNPNKSLRDRSVIGINILQNLTYENGEWVNGKLYVIAKGKELDVKLSLKSPDQLNLNISVARFSTTKTWTRSDES